MDQDFWRKCIVCKNQIAFKAIYYKCSVSSCDKKRAPAQFCSVECWDIHRSIMNHKSAGADEYKAPSKEKWLEEESNSSKVRLVRSTSTSPTSSLNEVSNDEILIVVSKLKAYVKDLSDLNTAADVMPCLSDIVRKACKEAISNARQDGRKTLMARDFKN